MGQQKSHYFKGIGSKSRKNSSASNDKSTKNIHPQNELQCEYLQTIKEKSDLEKEKSPDPALNLSINSKDEDDNDEELKQLEEIIVSHAQGGIFKPGIVTKVAHSFMKKKAPRSPRVAVIPKIEEIKPKIEFIEETIAEEKEAVKLTDFPILVVEILRKYLNPPSILALRATCKTTKWWIDSDYSLLKDSILRLEPDGAGFSEPINLNSPWSNFAIPYVHLQSPHIRDAVNNFRDLIWRLEVFTPKPPLKWQTVTCSLPNTTCLFSMINQCTVLEHLSLCRIETCIQLGDLAQHEKLRVLSIDRLQWMNNNDFFTFKNILMKCPHLEYVKVPEYEILGSLAFNFYDVNVSPEKEYLIRPLILYLDHYRNNVEGAPVSRAKKLYIDVLEFEDFRLCSSEIFYELSRKCVACNAVLMNVYFVPRDAVLRNQQDIVEGFASMFGFVKIVFQAELWKNLEVMECWIEDSPMEAELIVRQVEFLKTVSRVESLRTLTIRLSLEDSFICTLALMACTETKYEQIQKLIVRRHLLSPEFDRGHDTRPVEIPEGFGKAFTNLKYLYFQEMDSENKDFSQLWEGLPNLEELFMYKCQNLSQEAFLMKDKNDQPSILQLKKLHVLVIFLTSGGVNKFDDDFFMQALKFMKIRGFALRGSGGVDITEKGMLSLLDSPFHDTIEDFEAPSVHFRPSNSAHYWDFYIALPKKELRMNRIWLSCSVLLNSLSTRKHTYDFKRKCLEI